MKKYTYTVCLLFVFLGFELSAQTIEEARELYKQEKYLQALPAFEKEYKEKPTDAAINQWYGVCLFETNQHLTKAEECLTFASQKGIIEAYFYLGRIYTNTYRFDQATNEFEQYKKLKKKDKLALAKLAVGQEYQSFLMKHAQRPENLQIIDSLVVNKEDFLSAYKLSLSSGSLDYAQDASTIYLNEKQDKQYFAKQDSNRYSLYSKEKSLDGFGNEKQLSADNFGLSGNLNYPFVMADGVTLYFSAEDTKGFGGHDIYVTRYNLNNDSYLAPVRLNMPINSSYNDYMYVVDEEKGLGWFATDRSQEEGKVCVYTFIPNESVQLVESDDQNYLYRRAWIASISDSWKENSTYTDQIEIGRREAKKIQEIKKDFEFVINDQRTYYTYADFRSESAGDIYRQARAKMKQLKETEERLENLRNSYSTSKSNGAEILKLENQEIQLKNEVKEMEVKSRNQEINAL